MGEFKQKSMTASFLLPIPITSTGSEPRLASIRPTSDDVAAARRRRARFRHRTPEKSRRAGIPAREPRRQQDVRNTAKEVPGATASMGRLERGLQIFAFPRGWGSEPEDWRGVSRSRAVIRRRRQLSRTGPKGHI